MSHVPNVANHQRATGRGQAIACGQGEQVAPTMDALSLKESNHSRGDGSRIRGMVKAVLALPEVLIRSPRRISRAKILRASAKVDHCSMSNWQGSRR
ncbi:MAG TPA: hypothetical protein VK140_03915 [Ktedonobacteraceae bacterium]|nr:hypothetical protein [Ktedonobacteraceae bacterium]